MTKRQRTLLFFLLSGLFLVLVPVFVLYSQGYRIDWGGWRIAQTGAFYLRAEPARAEILIDGTLHKRTDFLFGSALTRNLFPGSYFVELAKEGYHSWQKVLDIAEREVTEAKHVLLFKKDISFKTLADGIMRSWESPDRRLLLFTKEGSPGVFLLDVATDETRTLLVNEEADDILWAPNSQRFLAGQTIYGVAPGDPCAAPAGCALQYLGANIQDIQFSPVSTDRIFFAKTLNASKVLSAAIYAAKEAPLALANSVLAFTAAGTSVFWLDRDGTLWQKEPAASARIFQQSVFTPLPGATYELIAAGRFLLVKENSKLFLHEETSAERREILSPVQEIILSPDGTKAALRNDTELWVLFLQEDLEQPRREAGETILLTRFSEPARNLFWIGSHHLLFSLDRSITTSEIDDRDRLNIAEIALFPEPRLFWDAGNGLLYVLSEGKLHVSERITR